MRKLPYAILVCTALGLGFSLPAAAAQSYEIKSFKDVDVDRSGFIENGEYQDYAFGMADWDNDGYLEDTEWASYTEAFYDPWEADYDSYTHYDTNGDGFIDRTEFNEFPLVDAWDKDNDDLIGEDDWDRVTVHFRDKNG